MQKKSQSSFFIINKEKLLKNLNALGSNNVCAMVKADAYGHGLQSICEIMRGKVKYFGVSTLSEALKIQETDKETPILIVGISDLFLYDFKDKKTLKKTFSNDESKESLNDENEKRKFFNSKNEKEKFLNDENEKFLNNEKSFYDGFCFKKTTIDIDDYDSFNKNIILNFNTITTVLKKNISITIDSLNQINEISKFLEKTNFDKLNNNKLKVHIKINSGMNRLGSNSLNEFKDILKVLMHSKHIIFEGIYTHFATPLIDIIYLQRQLKYFEKFLKAVPPIFNPIIHLGGGDILSMSEFQDKKYKNYMFRVGLKIYTHPNQILKIKSHVIKILNLHKGSRVGYSNGFICTQPSKIAVIPLGYADGINRKLTGKAYVNINGQNCKVVGNICMDMFFADVTNVECDVGNEVMVFDNSKKWAKICDTIPYEILTQLNFFRMNYIVE